MNELKELVSVAHSGRIGKIETLSTLKQGKDNLFFRLYKGIQEGKFLSDAEAMEELYGQAVAGSKYKMLKKRLLERLYTTILFLEPRQHRGNQAYFDAFYYCHKNYVVAKLLMGINAKKTGVKLMGKVLRRARSYHLFDLVQLCALSLRREHIEAGQVKDMLQYQKIFTQAHSIIAAEARADELYGRISIHFTRSLANQPKWIGLADKFLKEIAQLRQKYNTFRLNNNYFNLQILYYQIINDYEATLKVTVTFEDYLKKYPQFYSPIRQAHLHLIQLNCHLQLGNYEAGRMVAEEAIQAYSPGGANWYTVHEFYFLLCLNQKNYKRAAELYQTAVEHPKFSSITSWQSEIWKVLGGYLFFILSYAGEEKLLNEVFPSQTFRLAKLLNEIPIFSKDKRGFNVAILILQFLIALQKGAFVDIISRTDALKHYVYKFLSREEAYRSHIFVRMLLVVERNGFDPVITRSKTKALLARLKEKNISYNPTQFRIEIIPYEELWEMILVMLEKHK